MSTSTSYNLVVVTNWPGQLLAMITMVIAWLAQPTLLYAETMDVVIVAGSNPSLKPVRKTGIITEFTGKTLTIESPPGRKLRVPANQIVHIETQWNEEKLAGDRAYQKHKFQEATALYAQAADKEPRVWARRKIMVQSIWCFQNLGQPVRAASLFVALLESDPHTGDFNAIPLVWLPQQPDTTTEQLAVNWLSSQQRPIVHLMAASWLLSSPHHQQAREVLGQLLNHEDSRVAQLASTQLWRDQVHTVRTSDLARWHRILESMPFKFRAGPYFLLGTALAQHAHEEEAVIAYLRVSIQFAQHRALAAKSLLRAARISETLDRQDQAIRLYQELVDDYANWTAGDEARQHLARLKP